MKRRPLQNILRFVVATVLLSWLVLSCGGSSDNDERAQDPPVFPPAVFVADKDLDEIDELYAAFDDGTDIVKLSNKLVAEGDVVAFLVSPDGFFVAYVADQDTDGVFELYAVVVDKTTGDTAVKVSGATMAGSGILRLSSGEYIFDWAADSSRVAYIADQDTSGVFELFTSTPDGIENDLVSDLPDPSADPGRDVKDFEWEPDSTLIAYVADQDTDDKFELYVSRSDSNTDNRKVSGIPMVGSGISIRDREDLAPPEDYLFGWAPDSSRLAYIADQDIVDRFELFTSTPDIADNKNKKLSGSMGNNGNVDEFAWAPDNSKIAYLADQLNDFGVNLYTAFPNVSENPLKNSNGILEDESNVTGLQWAPDSLRIAFIANKIVSRFALYTTSRDDSNNVLVSSIRLDDSEVTFFDWAPDGSRIAYIADDFRIDVLELFTTRPDLPLVNKISGDLVPGGDVLEFEWAPDSSRVAYTADQDEDDVAELYTSTPDGGVNDIISGVMVAGGDVQDFKWAPDSSGVGYRADQDIDNVIELFASQPNGRENTKLSGTLVNGGDVFSFDWVP